MDGLDFPLPPENMLADMVDLSDYRLALGIAHPDHEPDPVILAWDGERWRRYTSEQARKVADDLTTDASAAMLVPVIEAFRNLAQRVDDLTFQGMLRRASKTAARARKHEPLRH